MLRRIHKTVSNLWRVHRYRFSHDPGYADVRLFYVDKPGSDTQVFTDGKAFLSRPNYRYERWEVRPAYAPVYPQPQLPDKAHFGQAITKGWPGEQYPPFHWYFPWRWRVRRAHWNHAGDWILVIGQVPGQKLRDQRLAYSDIWDVVLVPEHRATEWVHRHVCPFVDWNGGRAFIGYIPDLWLGNTGRHSIPFDPKDPLKWL